MARAVAVSMVMAVAMAGAMALIRTVAVIGTMAVAGTVAVAARVGPGLRFKGRQHGVHRQPPLAQQVGQHRILQDPQLAGMQFHRHMAVAEVIGRLQQGQGVGAAHQQQRFRRRLYPHQPIS